MKAGYSHSICQLVGGGSGTKALPCYNLVEFDPPTGAIPSWQLVPDLVTVGI